METCKLMKLYAIFILTEADAASVMFLYSEIPCGFNENEKFC